MQPQINQPYEMIKLDKYTGKIEPPALLLMNRSFDLIGKISNFDNWKAAFAANGLDEITFDVHKYANGQLCPVWDDLIDLKIVDVSGFGRFEISVNYTDNTETVKSIHGFSLETELAQISLYEFHVNDEEAADMEITEYSKDNYDSQGNFIPTTFYREISKEDSPETADFKRKHSLLHRILADKAPHWSVGYVTPYIALNEESQPEESSKFQRTYTVDGETIYDFLTGAVAEESNVVFVFDTINRKINCYSLCDCIDQTTGEIMTYKGEKVTGIGEDTMVFVSKNKLANEFNISSNKDNVKNCFRIEGGDDVITDMVRAVNMNGSNYIYQFSGLQYQDMSTELRKKIEDYQKTMSSEKTQNEYYGNGDMDRFLNGSLTLKVNSELDAACILILSKDNKVNTNNLSIHNYQTAKYWYIETTSDGTKELRALKTRSPYNTSDAINSMGIYARLCIIYDILWYFESSMMPNTDIATKPGKAEVQYNKLFQELNHSTVAVSSMDNYNNALFTGITKNIEAYAQVFLDSRFDLEIVKDTTSYSYTNGAKTGTWKGKMRITQHTDETNVYPAALSGAAELEITVNSDELEFAKQKVYKALSNASMSDIDFEVAKMSEDGIRNYFSQYSLNRLTAFYEGYNACLSVLMELGKASTSEAQNAMYQKYEQRYKIVESIHKKRQSQINEINEKIAAILREQTKFQKDHDFRTYLGEHYLEFCRYRREDAYTNSNYISDGLSTHDCIAKAKELLEAATKEAKKACVLQRTVSTSLNNLFALPEFEPLYDKFALFNYIRVRTEDEILKLRIIGIEFSGDSTEKIEVTFSDQIESLDGTLSDLQSIIKQAGSMATSYPSTVLQAKQGSEANGEIADIYNNGLNAAKAMLKNNDSNEVTITSSGIVCKRMDDEGVYGEKQLRITGNIMAFTDDNWQSVRMAIGETMFQNPVTGDKKPEYGIIAENIVGKLIAGDKAFIGNKNNNVLITGDGIDIANGSLCIANDTYSVELDPNQRLKQLGNYMQNGVSGNIRDDFLFCIRNKKIPIDNKNSDIIMGIDTSGNGYFKGRIEASEGKIANFNISENELYTDSATFGNDKGIYFGESGLNIKGKFKVDESGNLIATSGNIGGWEIENSRLSCNGGYGGNLNLDAEHGSIYSISTNNQRKTILTAGYISSTDGEYEALLNEAGLCFKKDNIQYALFNTAFWKGTEIRGVAINSYVDSKFISFGNKNKQSDDAFITPLVLNYGLNPDGNAQDILIYGSTLVKNNLYFNSNAYLSSYGNGLIQCKGKLCIGNSPGNDKKLNVDGGAHIYGSLNVDGNLDVGNDLEIHGNLYVSGATENTFTSAPNLHIGVESGKIAKTSGSSKRFKTEIKPVDANELKPEKLYSIDVVQYKFKENYLSKEDQRYNRDVIGFIAEDIYEKYPIAADYTIDDNGGAIVNDWNFRYMVPAMLKLIQDQKKEIDLLKHEIENLKSNYKTYRGL
ncbi:MAG: tail fiber domain-containing protein [Eubacterium sp.]|nr:tail fiber domain-containing protein [Eubacterium sp.]